MQIDSVKKFVLFFFFFILLFTSNIQNLNFRHCYSLILWLSFCCEGQFSSSHLQKCCLQSHNAWQVRLVLQLWFHTNLTGATLHRQYWIDFWMFWSQPKCSCCPNRLHQKRKKHTRVQFRLNAGNNRGFSLINYLCPWNICAFYFPPPNFLLSVTSFQLSSHSYRVHEEQDAG